MSQKPYTLPLNSPAPSFNLRATDNRFYSLEDFVAADLLVIFFTCNHCPYVTGSDEITRQTAEKYSFPKTTFVAINSNSAHTYPEDSYSHMVERMNRFHFPWVYLHDENQEIAKAYGALKTPHFFVFNKTRHLIYCGRAIDSPRDVSKMHVNDLENALHDYFAGKPIRIPLTNPIGCNIKWEGKEKHWMPDEACDLI